jgi:type II secretory pathway pseudopilin PulG
MRTRGRPGFTLLELIIALSVSVFVLVGIIAVTTSMVRYQFDASLRGSVTSGSLYSLQRMQKEIEETTYIAIPTANNGTSDTLAGCTNWSKAAAARVDANSPVSAGCSTGNNVTSYFYCVSGGILYRHYNCGTTCSPDYRTAAAPTCGVSGTFDVVVPVKPGISKGDNFTYYFKRVNTSDIEMHYIIGKGTFSATNVSPASVKVNTTLSTNKSYGGTSE